MGLCGSKKDAVTPGGGETKKPDAPTGSGAGTGAAASAAKAGAGGGAAAGAGAGAGGGKDTSDDGEFLPEWTDNIETMYELDEKILGKGSFGEVVCGHDKSKGETFAVKLLSKVRFGDGDKDASHLEAKIMTRLKGHPHVVNIEHYLEDKANMYFVMEWCKGGDLMKYVYKCKHFSEKVASALFQQMLLGVQHCHNNGVVHRDLKPDNFLFASTEGRTHLKLADFGLATLIKNPDDIITDVSGVQPSGLQDVVVCAHCPPVSCFASECLDVGLTCCGCKMRCPVALPPPSHCRSVSHPSACTHNTDSLSALRSSSHPRCSPSGIPRRATSGRWV